MTSSNNAVHFGGRAGTFLMNRRPLLLPAIEIGIGSSHAPTSTTCVLFVYSGLIRKIFEVFYLYLLLLLNHFHPSLLTSEASPRAT